MARRCFLHVGSPKTGTTYLQSVLWAQQECARKQGLLLPGRSVRDHLLAALDLRDSSGYVINPENVPGSWKSTVDAALAWDGDVLISHELFSPTPESAARRAVAELSEGAEVHVVVTARDLARQFPAHWQENVKARDASRFDDFMADVRADKERVSWFWRVQDSAAILSRWGGHLPADRLHVVTLPPPGGTPTVLWERFATLLGLDVGAFELEAPRRNESLGAEQTELLRRINEALGDRLQRPGPYPAVVKGVLAHQVLAGQPGTRLSLRGADVGFAAEESLRIVDDLAALGANVVGDLRELVPQASAPTVDTAVVDDAGILEASIEALITVLEKLHTQSEQRKVTNVRLRQELRDCRRELETLRQATTPTQRSRRAYSARGKGTELIGRLRGALRPD